MPTRFYFPFDLAADVTPVGPFGAWLYTSEHLVRKLVTAKIGGDTLAAGVRIGPWSSRPALDRQYVSEPMEAGIIFNIVTVTMQLMTREWNNGDNSTSNLAISVCSEDGQTEQVTLLAVANYGPATEYINNATHRNKTFADGDGVAGYTTVSGDRLVVEVGHTDSAGSTPEGECRFGCPSATSDLPVNETQTTAGVGWIEFSNTITFVQPFTAPPKPGIILQAITRASSW